jgi:hypothetical protein
MLANLFGADLGYVMVIFVVFAGVIGGIIALILHLAHRGTTQWQPPPGYQPGRWQPPVSHQQPRKGYWTPPQPPQRRFKDPTPPSPEA